MTANAYANKYCGKLIKVKGNAVEDVITSLTLYSFKQGYLNLEESKLLDVVTLGSNIYLADYINTVDMVDDENIVVCIFDFDNEYRQIDERRYRYASNVKYVSITVDERLQHQGKLVDLHPYLISDFIKMDMDFNAKEPLYSIDVDEHKKLKIKTFNLPFKFQLKGFEFEITKNYKMHLSYYSKDASRLVASGKMYQVNGDLLKLPYQLDISSEGLNTKWTVSSSVKLKVVNPYDLLKRP
jgi:hypothetical protein